MAQYGKQEYWEDRYQKDKEPFDWYQRYSGVKDMITQYIQPSFQILVVGCGNSKLSEDMFEDGYQNITNIDNSYNVIKQMTDHYKEKIPQMTFKVMDTKSLQFEDGSFDAVIDKACFDSILCGDGSGPNSENMLNEIHRVLSPNGVYICISYGVPENRMGYFNKGGDDWTVFTQKAAKPTISTSTVISAGEKDDNKNFHFIYIMRKAPKKE